MRWVSATLASAISSTTSLTLSACAGAPPLQSAAIIVHPDSASRDNLRSAVSRMLGVSSVVLAEDALTQQSALIVEPVRLRDPEGHPAQGREIRQPEHFELLKVGRQCVLLHERTNRRVVLDGVECISRSATNP